MDAPKRMPRMTGAKSRRGPDKKRDIDWIMRNIDCKVETPNMKPPSKSALALWRLLKEDEPSRRKFLLGYYVGGAKEEAPQTVKVNGIDDGTVKLLDMIDEVMRTINNGEAIRRDAEIDAGGEPAVSSEHADQDGEEPGVGKGDVVGVEPGPAVLGEHELDHGEYLRCRDDQLRTGHADYDVGRCQSGALLRI